jgi:hypothetical protein
MRSRAVALTVAMALALAGSTGCAMSKNQRQGVALLGGAAVIVGGTVMVDGWTCDEANWANASCTHDNKELLQGGITIAAGAALLTWALLQVAGADAGAPASETTRTAKAKAP